MACTYEKCRCGSVESSSQPPERQDHECLHRSCSRHLDQTQQRPPLKHPNAAVSFIDEDLDVLEDAEIAARSSLEGLFPVARKVDCDFFN